MTNDEDHTTSTPAETGALPNGSGNVRINPVRHTQPNLLKLARALIQLAQNEQLRENPLSGTGDDDGREVAA